MRKLLPFFAAGALFLIVILLVLPSTNQAVFESFGLQASQASPIYNGFEPFIPYIPSYFPDDFEITYAGNGSNTSPEINTYTETYASDNYFFRTIQSQGPAVPEFEPDPGFMIQDQPAKLTQPIDLNLVIDDDLDLSQFEIEENWVITVVLKEINIQVVSNLPREEAIQVAEGLIPSICTSTPTPDE